MLRSADLSYKLASDYQVLSPHLSKSSSCVVNVQIQFMPPTSLDLLLGHAEELY